MRNGRKVLLGLYGQILFSDGKFYFAQHTESPICHRHSFVPGNGGPRMSDNYGWRF